MVGTARPPSAVPATEDGLRRPRPKRAQRLPAALPPGTAQRAVPTGFRTDTSNNKSKTPDVVSYYGRQSESRSRDTISEINFREQAGSMVSHGALTVSSG